MGILSKTYRFLVKSLKRPLVKFTGFLSSSFKALLQIKLKDYIEKSYSLLKYFVKLSILLFIIYWIGFNLYLLCSHKYYLAETQVSEIIKNKGLNGETAQKLIVQNIRNIIKQSNYYDQKSGVVFEAENKSDFEIEYDGLKIRDFFNKTLFFKKKIETSVVCNSDYDIKIQYNIDNQAEGEVVNQDSLPFHESINTISFQLAIEIIRHISPITIAYFKYSQQDYVGCVQEIDNLLQLNKIREKDKRADIIDLKVQCYYQLGKYYEAIPFLKSKLKKNDDYFLKLDLIDSYANIRDFVHAIQLFHSIKEPTYAYDNYRKASYYGVKGNYYCLIRQFEKAVPLLQKAKNLDRTYPGYFVNLGACYANLKLYDSASYYLDTADKLDSSKLFTDSWRMIGYYNDSLQQKKEMLDAKSAKKYKYGCYYYARHLIESNKSQDSIFYYLKQSLKIDSNFALGHYELGNQYNIKMLYDNANIEYIRADRQFPYNDDIYIARIYNLCCQGDYEQAKTLCQLMLERNPLNYKIKCSLAYISDLTHDVPKVGYFYSTALSLNPNYFYSLVGYRYYKKKSKDYHAVITLSNKALSLDSTDNSALIDLAEASANIGHFEYALELTNRLIKKNELLFESHRLKGRINEKLGNIEIALSEYQYATSIRPDSESMRYNAIYFLTGNRDLKKAFFWYDKFRVNSTFTVDDYFNWGYLLEKFGRFKEAANTFNVGFAKFPNNCLLLKYWHGELKLLKENPMNNESYRAAIDFSNCDITKLHLKY